MGKNENKKTDWKADDRLTMVITKGDNGASDKKLTMKFTEAKKETKE